MTHGSQAERLSARRILDALRDASRADKAEFLPGFFRAVPGGYGEGDCFLGVIVPEQRRIARHFRDLPQRELKKLLASKWHECRLTALFILVLQFEVSTSRRAANPERAQDIVDFYLENLQAVNNWDLVDSSAPKILGRWLLYYPAKREVLSRLVHSDVLWERRIAVLATMPLIAAGRFDEILQLAELLLDDRHDLMHKAIGWMLREVGRKDPDVLRRFLGRHSGSMPRTMLRYATGKLSPVERNLWMRQ